jgi:hypothetical protein
MADCDYDGTESLDDSDAASVKSFDDDDAMDTLDHISAETDSANESELRKRVRMEVEKDGWAERSSASAPTTYNIGDNIVRSDPSDPYNKALLSFINTNGGSRPENSMEPMAGEHPLRRQTPDFADDCRLESDILADRFSFLNTLVEKLQVRREAAMLYLQHFRWDLNRVEDEARRNGCDALNKHVGLGASGGDDHADDNVKRPKRDLEGERCPACQEIVPSLEMNRPV